MMNLNASEEKSLLSYDAWQFELTNEKPVGAATDFSRSRTIKQNTSNHETRLQVLTMDALTLFGLVAVSAMLIFYALEDHNDWSILAFAGACVVASVYGFLQGAWPFGIIEPPKLSIMRACTKASTALTSCCSVWKWCCTAPADASGTFAMSRIETPVTPCLENRSSAATLAARPHAQDFRSDGTRGSRVWSYAIASKSVDTAEAIRASP
jgi:hypothetical protein